MTATVSHRRIGRRRPERALPRNRRWWWVLGAGLLLPIVGAGVALAAFTSSAVNGANTFSSAPDWVAPDGSTVIEGAGASSPGFVVPGGELTVFAQLDDTGSPASGVATVTADVSGVVSGATAEPLTSTGGPWLVGGISYNHMSSVVSVDAGLSDGPVTYQVTVTDNDGNSRTVDGTVVVDGTAPVATASVAARSTAVTSVAPGVDYHVYANVTEVGQLDQVTGDLSAVTTGATSVAFTATGGPWTVGGVSYEYRSASLTADATLADGTYAYTVATADGAGNTSADGFTASVASGGPTVDDATVERAAGGGPGYLAEGSSFHLYASVSDAGAGVASVTGDPSALAGGESAVSLTSTGGPWVVGGTSYGWRSGALTADAPLAEGSIAYTVTAEGGDGQTSSPASFSVTIDNTAPAVARSTIAPDGSTTGGTVSPGASFRVYADASDSSAGVGTVTTDVSTIASGQTAASLSSTGGPWTIDGASYSHRSAVVTADATLPAGPLGYDVTAADTVANTTTASFSVAVDDGAPSVTASVIERAAGGGAGFLAAGDTYYVFASASDAGGLASVTADVSTVTGGQSATSLTDAGGPWTVGGVTYTHRSAPVTADGALTEGTKAYSVTATDGPGNTDSAGYSLTIDNTSPSIAGAVIEQAAGGAAGYLAEGQTYYVYADVADAAAGVASVTADVSSVTAGQSSVSLTATGAPWTVGGSTYNRRSAALTADSPLSEGSKPYAVTASDNVGNSLSNSALSVTIDNSSPGIAGAVIERTSGGGAGYVAQGDTYFVYASVSDGSSGVGTVTADVSSVTAGQTSVVLTGTGGPWTVGGTTYNRRSSSVTADDPLAEGAKSFSVAATDGVGNSLSNSTLTVTVDNTGPVVTAAIVERAAGGGAGHVAQGQPYHVYANVSDAAGVGTVTADVSSITTGQTSAALTATGGPWTVDGTTYNRRSASLAADDPLAEGSKTYSIAASDTVGNSTSGSYSVTVDNTAPVITTSVVERTAGGGAGFVAAGQSYYVYANVSDASAGVGAVTVDVSSITSGQTAAALSATGGPWTVDGTTYSWRSVAITADNPLSEGAKAYTLTASDSVGNGQTAGGYSVTVDNTAPAVTAAVIRRSTGGGARYIAQGQTYHVYANVTEASSGVAAVTASVSTVSTGSSPVALGTTGGPWTVNGVTYNHRSSLLTADNPLAEGSKSYSITAADAVANSSTSLFSVTVDNTPPSVARSVIERTAGGGAGYVGQGQTYYVYAHVTDAAAGVSTVTADVANVTTGQTAVTLTTTGGPWTVNGSTYNRRSASLTADNPLTAGAKSYSVATTDWVANTATTSFSVTVDNTAPSVTAAVIQKSTGGTTGYVRQGGTYYVYANVTDASSGVGTVTANAANVTTGQTAVALSTSGGPWTVNGTSYNRRSALLTATNPLAAGSKTWSVTAADNVSNTAMLSYSVTVDNTVPSVGGATEAVVDGQNPGYIGQGMTFYVYANASDGVVLESLTANVSNVATGQTAVTLSSAGGPWTVSGTSYTYRTALISANGTLAGGSYSYTVTATDAAGNTTTSSQTVTVDNNATVQPASGLTLTPSCVVSPGIAFRGAASNAAHSTSLTIGKPPGVVANDVLLAGIYSREPGSFASSGWSEFINNGNISVLYKVAGSSEPASYTFSVVGGSTLRMAGGIVAYSGVDTTAPLDAYGSQAQSSTNIVAPSITTSLGSTKLVGFFGQNEEAAITVPASMTARFSRPTNEAGSSSHQTHMASADETFSATGATGTRTATSANAGANNRGALVALRPLRIPRVTAAWTATPSTFASGYRLERWLGGSLQAQYTITPRTTVSYADDAIAESTAYSYRLRASAGTAPVWLSSEISGSVTSWSC